MYVAEAQFSRGGFFCSYSHVLYRREKQNKYNPISVKRIHIWYETGARSHLHRVDLCKQSLITGCVWSMSPPHLSHFAFFPLLFSP